MKKLREFVKEKVDEINNSQPSRKVKFKIADVARACDMTPQALNSMLARNSPNVTTLGQLAAVLKVPTAELLQYVETKNEFDRNAKLLDDYNYVDIPYISVQARAGVVKNYGDILTEDTYAVVREPGVNYDNTFVFEINGDSMEPTVTSGSKVLCKLVQEGDWEYINSGLYVVMFADYLCLKRIKSNHLNTTGMLELHSDNEDEGGSIHIKKDDIKSIWKYKATVYAIAK